MPYTSFLPYVKAMPGARFELGKRPNEAVMRRRFHRDNAIANRVLALRDRLDRALKKQEV